MATVLEWEGAPECVSYLVCELTKLSGGGGDCGRIHELIIFDCFKFYKFDCRYSLGI